MAPSFMVNLNEADGPYDHAEILEILSTDIWTFPVDENEEAV